VCKSKFIYQLGGESNNRLWKCGFEDNIKMDLEKKVMKVVQDRDTILSFYDDNY
jgi:hypothetical protein